MWVLLWSLCVLSKVSVQFCHSSQKKQNIHSFGLAPKPSNCKYMSSKGIRGNGDGTEERRNKELRRASHTKVCSRNSSQARGSLGRLNSSLRLSSASRLPKRGRKQQSGSQGKRSLVLKMLLQATVKKGDARHNAC